MKAGEQAGRHQAMADRAAALAEKHGGTGAKGTDKLKLNVGGTRVVVRRETLTQVRGSRLAALFSGRWESRLLRDKKNRVFLDVNPACFKKIVDWHIAMKLAGPDDPPELPQVPVELKPSFDTLWVFFGLGEEAPPADPRPKVDSAILGGEPELHAAMQGWLDEPGPCSPQSPAQCAGAAAGGAWSCSRCTAPPATAG